MEDNKIKELMKKYIKDGKMDSYPTKRFRAVRPYLYEFMASKFSYDKLYVEKEINEIIKANINFSDYIIVRREMVEQGLLSRLNDGSKYWLNKDYISKL